MVRGAPCRYDRDMKTRQKARRAAVIASFVLLPVTLYYFSPVLSLGAAAAGVLSGSVLVFGLMLLCSLFLGRLFCGWACPVGGAQEIVFLFRRRPVNRRRTGWIKWLIWAPWMVMMIFFILRAGGVRQVDPFYQTRGGISVTDLPGIIAYVAVVALFVVLALTVGRRAGCHAVCWMAPFMVIGRAIRNSFGWPALALRAEAERCTGCGTCSDACSMSIDVSRRVPEGRLECRDCILCGACADACPRQVIRFSFRGKRPAN
jgi:ferredoxin-type protein NapH